jgi:hypothetical protein
MVLYNQESGIMVIPMNRMRPRPKKGAGLIARGASIKTRNEALKCDYTQKELRDPVSFSPYFPLGGGRIHFSNSVIYEKCYIMFKE